MALSPASLARTSARHPWWTIGGWLVAVAVAAAAAALWLGDALTTNNGLTNTPEAEVADNLITERFFPPGPRDVTEFVYVHSATLTVDDPAFRAFVGRIGGAIAALGPDAARAVTSHYEAGPDALVALDRHSTWLVVTLNDDFPERRNRAAYFAALEGLDQDPVFEIHPLRVPGTGRTEVVIVESAVHAAASAEARAFVEDLFLDIIRLGRGVVGGGVTYYATGDPGLISRDGTATMIPVILNNRDRVGEVIDVVKAAREDRDFEVAITGNATVDNDFNEISARDLQQGELQFGLPAAIVVLVLVFGAIVAAIVPLVVAFLSIAVAVGLAAIVGTMTDLSIFLVNMIFMMGLAVGIDYSLFIVARFREERANGLSVPDAVARAGDTASRAVLFSGVTVILALAGLLLVQATVFFSLGMGAILVVVAAVLASLTLLPAMLSLLGDRINRLRIPFFGRAAERQGGRIWDAIARGVMRAPVVSLILSAGLLVALAAPVLDLRTGASGVSSFPDSFESKRGFAILDAKFSSGIIAPTHIVIDGNVDDPAVRAAIDELRRLVEADGTFGPVVEDVNPARNTAWLRTQVISGDAVSDAAVAAVRRLRGQYIPAAFADVPARALVAGETAGNIDWFTVADAAAPVVFTIVLALSFVLLLVVFRSIVIPVKAILMNLLSVGAAYGLLVLVFQKGVAIDLFGFTRADTVEAWIPVFLFSVLFGLSMDYYVFLLSRIRERFVETGDNAGSVAFGVRSTGRLITGAALIMVAVFAGFASGDLVMFQQVGFGLGAAVLIDATIVRSVLVPASMRLLGDWNWYLPRFLRWLPRLNIEGAASATRPDAMR